MSRKPMTGHHYTVGAIKHRSGDRSWIGHIWLVLESNGAAALIRDPFAKYNHSFGREPMVVSVDEFDWTPADEMAAAMTPNENQAIGEAA